MGVDKGIEISADNWRKLGKMADPLGAYYVLCSRSTFYFENVVFKYFFPI